MTQKKSTDREDPNRDVMSGVEGIFKGVSSFIDRLQDLIETGEELRTEREFTHDGKIKGVYGLNFKVGLGKDDKEVKVEPFGNLHKNKETGQAEVREIREPMVDVFKEDTRVLVVAEMPGISEDDIKLDVEDDILTLSADNNTQKYHKEILLPCVVHKANMKFSCNNGIVEIVFAL